MKLSILIPVYNERTVVERSLSQVLASPLPEEMERELIIVDDCSTDGTLPILERLAAADPNAIRRPEKLHGLSPWAEPPRARPRAAAPASARF